MTFQRVMRVDDLWIGEKRGETLSGKPVLLVNVEGQICAYADRCAHRGVRLSEGHLDGHVLVCAAHEWSYDVRTGCGINPSVTQLYRYPIRVENGDLLVDVDP